MLMLLFVLLCISIILLVCLLISIYYRITRTSLSASEALANINIALEKRYELIPDLVKTVKKHNPNGDTITKELTKVREQALLASSFEEIVETNALLSTHLSTLLDAANSLPKLKADTRFKTLKKSLHKIEEEFSHAKDCYNSLIKKYNRLVTIFPNVIIAHFIGAKPKKFFSNA